MVLFIIDEVSQKVKDTKGFTLVELLAVIVILAVIMLMAVTAVTPIMEKSRKSALGDEGLQLVEAAKMAFQAEQMGTAIKYKATDTVCFSMAWLYKNNYFDYGSGNVADGDGYVGSVLVAYDKTTKNYNYTFWIDNGTYAYNNVPLNTYGYDKAVPSDTGTAINNCGGASTTTGLNADKIFS